MTTTTTSSTTSSTTSFTTTTPLYHYSLTNYPQHLLGHPVSFTDLEYYDARLYESLKYIEQNDDVGMLALSFAVDVDTSRGGPTSVETVPLVDRGEDIEVDDDNKMLYIERMFQCVTAADCCCCC